MAAALLKRTWTPHQQQQHQQQQQQPEGWMAHQDGSLRIEDEGVEGPPVEVRDQGNGNVKVRSGNDVPHLVSLGSGRLSTSITLLPLPEQGFNPFISARNQERCRKLPVELRMKVGGETLFNLSWFESKLTGIIKRWLLLNELHYSVHALWRLWDLVRKARDPECNVSVSNRVREGAGLGDVTDPPWSKQCRNNPQLYPENQQYL